MKRPKKKKKVAPALPKASKRAAVASEENRERLRNTITAEIRRLQKASAVLTPSVWAANHEVEFDAADVMAVALMLVEQTLHELDRLQVAV